MPKMKPKIKKADTTQKVSKKLSKKPVAPHKWLGSIPLGSHGSTPVQKKLWKVTSDFKRISDWYDYGGRCIACNKRVEHWSILQAGHYRAYSICRGYRKFSTINIFGQCAFCNSAGGTINKDGNSVGYNFAMGIVERYGVERLEELENFQNSELQKLEDHVMIEMIRDIIIKMDVLPEKPSYYQNARRKIKEEMS